MFQNIKIHKKQCIINVELGDIDKINYCAISINTR